jgi:hypothetical protein
VAAYRDVFTALPQGGAPVRSSRSWVVPWYRGGVDVLISLHGVGRFRDFVEIAAATWVAGRGCERLLRNFRGLPQGGAPVRSSRSWVVPWYRGGVDVLISLHGVGRFRDFVEIAAATWVAGRGCERLLRNFRGLPQGGAPVRDSRSWVVPWYRGGVVVLISLHGVGRFRDFVEIAAATWVAGRGCERLLRNFRGCRKEAPRFGTRGLGLWLGIGAGLLF